MPVDTVPAPHGPTSIKPHTRWRTHSQEMIYGQKLLSAIKSANSSSLPSTPPRAIKDAADSALALTAKPQTRWSRAILSRQWRKRKLLMKLRGKIRRRSPWSPPLKSSPATAREPLGKRGGDELEVSERLRVLSRLVPGCRKLSAPTLLEEAADYVAALQMQVRAMRMLADRLSAATLTENST